MLIQIISSKHLSIRSIENTYSSFQLFWLQIKIIFLFPYLSPHIVFPQKLSLKVSTHWLLIRAEQTQLIVQNLYHITSDARLCKSCSWEQSGPVYTTPLQDGPPFSFPLHTRLMFPMERERQPRAESQFLWIPAAPLQIPEGEVHKE